MQQDGQTLPGFSQRTTKSRCQILPPFWPAPMLKFNVQKPKSRSSVLGVLQTPAAPERCLHKRGRAWGLRGTSMQCSLQSTCLRSHERFLKHHELCKHKVWSGTLISGAKPPRAVQVSANSGTQVHGTSKHCLTQTETPKPEQSDSEADAARTAFVISHRGENSFSQ